MPNYRYVAIDKNGKNIKGKLNAANELDLEERIESLECVLLSNQIIKKSVLSFGGSIHTKDLIMFCIHLEQLDKAGVPLLDALADMRDSSENLNFRDVMADLYESVRGGDVLSEALHKKPEVFDDTFVGLVSAGEKTGQLAVAFAHLADHLKWNDDFKRSIKKAVRYPIALLSVMAILITFMMMFVVPQLIEFMTSQGFDLPIYTTALIATSKFFTEYWYILLLTPIILLVVFKIFYRTSYNFHLFVDELLLKSPIIGPVSVKMNMARFSRFFSITFNSGIGIIECLKTAQKVVSNAAIYESVNEIIKNVTDGNSITKSLAMTGNFPTMVVRMFKVGEDSGNMEQALDNINFFYQREVADSVEKMVGMIQPILTIFMGITMLWIIIAVFGPLYSSFGDMNF